MALPNMFYTYILYSKSSQILYYGYTPNLKKRLEKHNLGNVKSTKPHKPWILVWYGAFITINQAKEFEKYLKSGSGKAFCYNRLVN